jgi:serine/threonine-protein kinase HipA
VSTELVVLLDDIIAGTLTSLPDGRLYFTYANSYSERPNATPVSVSMPTQIPVHQDHIVTPWLWNLLPDNPAVLDRWAREFQVSKSSPFSLLGTPIGQDCAGAIRFIEPTEVNEALSRQGTVTWLTDDEVAQRIRDMVNDSTAWLGRSFSGQFSLAGAQPKTALLYRDARWGVPHGATPTTHILKPAVSGFADQEINEHMCLEGARLTGLLAARTRVSQFGDQTAIVVDRYDRIAIADEIARVHQEDLCQALGYPPDKKYQNEGGPGPVDIVGLLRRVMLPSIADQAIYRFVDALAWNWLIGGTDAHAKNYSLLLANGQVRLAPLYDVASTLPYGIHEKKLRLAMKVGKSDDIYPYHNNWPTAARQMGLDATAVLSRVRELTIRAPEAFAEAAKAPGVAALASDLPGTLVDLIADRASRCLRLIDSPSAN